MTVNFSLLALDQILNNAVTIPHMSGGQCRFAFQGGILPLNDFNEMAETELP